MPAVLEGVRQSSFAQSSMLSSAHEQESPSGKPSRSPRVIALAAWMIYPIDKKVRLGLDLKGGVHLVLSVQTDDALRLGSEAAMERIRAELTKAGATGVTAALDGPTEAIR